MPNQNKVIIQKLIASISEINDLIPLLKQLVQDETTNVGKQRSDQDVFVRVSQTGHELCSVKTAKDLSQLAVIDPSRQDLFANHPNIYKGLCELYNEYNMKMALSFPINIIKQSRVVINGKQIETIRLINIMNLIKTTPIFQPVLLQNESNINSASILEGCIEIALDQKTQAKK